MYSDLLLCIYMPAIDRSLSDCRDGGSRVVALRWLMGWYQRMPSIQLSGVSSWLRTSARWW